MRILFNIKYNFAQKVLSINFLDKRSEKILEQL